MIEKKICMGKLRNGISKKTNNPYYAIDYLDCENGLAHTDYVSQEEYEKIDKKGIKVGTIITGLCRENEYQKIVLTDIKA